MRGNPRVARVMNQQAQRWTNVGQPVVERRAPVFRGFVNRFSAWRQNHGLFFNSWWRRHHFFGGCFFGFVPIFDIGIYFYNPMVYWLFAPNYDPQYYSSAYGDEIDAYPDSDQPFQYNNLYYPTENLKQLLFDVSEWPTDDQMTFRTAIETFTEQLARRVDISDRNIVITNYAILGDNDGISVDGVVNQNGSAYNFKGVIDIRQPETSDVFVTDSMEREPTREELNRLDAINGKIEALGGETEPAASGS